MSDNERTTRTRRRVLTGIAGSTVVALAGCTGDEDSDDESATEDTEMDEDEDRDDESEVNYSDPEGSVSFVTPEDGATVTSPVEVEMDAEDFDVEAAAEGVHDGRGHLHILVDQDPLEPGEEIPATEGYNHYGDGQLETELDLEAGEYDLVLQAADGAHIAYDLTDEISITVEAE